MAIKDLQKDKPGLARAGIIRLGYKVKKCKACQARILASYNKCPDCGKADFGPEYPMAADHFVLDEAPGLTEVLGPKPTELRVFLPFEEIDQVFPAYHQYWVASALVCRGDGEDILYGINPQKGEVIIRDGTVIADFESKDNDGVLQAYKKGDPAPCPGMAHDLYPKCQHCKPNAMLLVMLRDVPRLAYYQIATTSIHNIVTLTEQLTFIRQTAGRLRGVPFILRLAPRKISVPKKGGGRQRVEKYLLSLEVDQEWVRSLMDKERRRAEPLLEAGDTEEVIDVEPVRRDPDYGSVEPPVWMPPGGDDDNGDLDDLDEHGQSDLERFIERVLSNIPFYETKEQILRAIEGLEYIPAYDAGAEEIIFEALAEQAEKKADIKAEAGF